MIYDRIEELKKNQDAVILAHYYVDREIQNIADYVGDSFYLAQIAEKLNSKTIIVAGVYFMAESVKILNHDKTVRLVDNMADCPMAHMVSIEKINEVRSKYNDLVVVCYINSTAEIKAHSDVCVTSSNAVKIVSQLKEKNIFFVPDGNLGRYVSEFVKEKNIILNDGYCPVHNKVDRNELENLKRKFKQAKVLSHPECKEEILKLSDYVGSTKGIIEQVEKYGDCKEFIIVTERGISSELSKKYPDKKFYYLSNIMCKDMKSLTLEKLENTMKNKENEIFVDKDTAKKALISLERMLKLGVR